MLFESFWYGSSVTGRLRRTSSPRKAMKPVKNEEISKICLNDTFFVMFR